MRLFFFHRFRILSLSTACAFVSCFNTAGGLPFDLSKEFLKFSTTPAPQTTQILLIKGSEPPQTGAKITLFEKHDGRWRKILGPFPATLAKKGFVIPVQKKEGDEKTPTGIYPISIAFGTLGNIDTKLPYTYITDTLYWINDSNHPDYNKIADKMGTALTFIEMKHEDELYKYGAVIDYNTNPIEKEKGTSVFLHVWKRENLPTTGSIAAEEETVRKILGRLDIKKAPIAILSDHR